MPPKARKSPTSAAAILKVLVELETDVEILQRSPDAIQDRPDARPIVGYQRMVRRGLKSVADYCRSVERGERDLLLEE